MQQTVVKPPAAAASVPVRIVSFSSKPGSRRCVCRSTNPGVTTSLAASIVLAPAGAANPLPTSATTPSRSSTSTVASTPLAGSITRPPRIRMGASLPETVLDRPATVASCHQVEQRHAHRHAVGHLLLDHALGAVGHVRH